MVGPIPVCPGQPAFVSVGEVRPSGRRCSVLQYDLGYFHDKPRHLEPIDNPFGSKALPVNSGIDRVILASLRIPSWNQIAGFLESMR